MSRGWNTTHTLLLIIILLLLAPLLLFAGCVAGCFVLLPDASNPHQSGPQPSADQPASVGNHIDRNGVRVTLVAAGVQSVRYRIPFSRELKPTAEDVFRVELLVANVSETRKVDYSSYVSALGVGTTLRDGVGNVYHQRTANSDFDLGSSRRLDPRENVSEVLLFEMPLANSTTLKLTLSRWNIASDEDVQFEIKSEQWQKK